LFSLTFLPQIGQQTLQDIKMLSMPDCLPAGSSHQMQFLIRIREKELNHPNYFLNCFISFTQSRDSSYKRGFSQRSLVLVCKHTFSILSYSVLYQLGLVLDGLQKPAPTPSSPSSDENIDSAIEVAYQHFLGWPYPQAGQQLLLPFYGEIVIFQVPSLMTYVDCGVDTSPNNSSDGLMVDKNHIHTGLGGGAGVFGDEDLVGLLKSLGLLPHLWTLWELVMTGKDILIWAPSADLCSRLVSALVSLAAPLSYGGDFRPYINPYDSDVSLLSAVSKKKYELYLRNENNSSASSSRSSGTSQQHRSGRGSRCQPPCGYPSHPNSRDREGNRESMSVFEAFEAVSSASFSDYPPPLPTATATAAIGTNSVGNGLRVGTLDIPTQAGNFSEFHDMIVRYSFTTGTGASSGPGPGPASISITRAVSENSISGKKNSGSCLGNSANPKIFPLTSMIVGITNPFLLKSFSHFDAAIFLPMCSLSPIRFHSGQNLGSPCRIQIHVKATTDGNVSPLSASKSRKKSLYSSRSSTSESSAKNDNDTSSSASSSSSSSAFPFTSGSASGSQQSAIQYQCHVSHVTRDISLEQTHEKWIQNGGAGTELGNGNCKGSSLIVIRQSISVKQDQRIIQLLSNPTLVEDLNQNQYPFSAFSSAMGSSSGFEDEGMIQTREDRDTTVQNMLIREHFRHLTYALMKPFESHFQPRAIPLHHLHQTNNTMSSSPSTSSSSGIGRWDSSSTTATAAAASAAAVNSVSTSAAVTSTTTITSISSPTRRIGASFLWLYRNPLELLGDDPIPTLVESYRKTSKNIPTCFSSSKRQELFTSFGESDTFLNFYHWRRRHLSVQLMMEMALACSMLTGEELIEQFAIEKGSDVVTEKQVRELSIRIQLYIQTLQNIQTDSQGTTQELIGKMADHLEVISSLSQSMLK
jgi:hypothetical protein